jgi:FMN phosphatase YigB (HAD superfamily)
MIDAWLVDLDGTLYRPRPLKLVMALQLALRGRRAIPVIREFRHQHERVREELEGIAASSPFDAQVDYTARALDMSPAAVRPIVDEWMIQRPCSHLRRFRRTNLLEEIRAFRGDVRAEFEAVRAEYGTIRDEARHENGKLRDEFRGEIQSLRSEMDERFDTVVSLAVTLIVFLAFQR